MNDEERSKLYSYLIDKFPLYCNSHNAIKHTLNQKGDIADITIYILDRLIKEYKIRTNVKGLSCECCTHWDIDTKMLCVDGNIMAICNRTGQYKTIDNICDVCTLPIDTKRISMEEVFMRMALNVAARSTCSERLVGAIITPKDFDSVYSIGYNGNSKGRQNACDGIGYKGSCGCVHAEMNALEKCYVKDRTKVMFVTLAPCVMCAKLMVNSGFSTVYYYNEGNSVLGLTILRDAGIEVRRLEFNV